VTSTALDLRSLVHERLADAQVIVVSNREPYVHSHAGGGIVCQVPAGGLVTALDPVMRACGGTWVAHGAGDADRAVVDGRDRVLVPPPDGPASRDRYRLKRVWLSKAEEQGYYYGFANQALWPLCHQAFVRPRFEAADWETYRAVNRRFAEAVLDELEPGPALVLIQDYHFALLPRMLKEARPDLAVAQFWHIPWPTRDAFGICPWAGELLDGLLGNDLLGFHTQQHCAGFLYTVDRTLESVVDYEHATVQRQGRQTLVRPREAPEVPLGAPAGPLRQDGERQHLAGAQPGRATRPPRVGAVRPAPPAVDGHVQFHREGVEVHPTPPLPEGRGVRIRPGSFVLDRNCASAV